MDPINVGQLIITFFAGILSILSPCILPLLPGFLAYFAGLTLDEAKIKSHRKVVFLNSIFFSLGFTLTFLAFGLAISSLSLLLIQNQILLQQIGGVILIIFGVLQTGWVNIAKLQKELKLDHQKLAGSKHFYLRSLIIGAVFAFSWTPCYGPIIGGIFTLGASTTTLGQSLLLFLFYSLGFTLPILLLSIALDQLSALFVKHRKLFRLSHLIAGLLLILMGILMLTNSISSIVNWLNFIYTQNQVTFF